MKKEVTSKIAIAITDLVLCFAPLFIALFLLGTIRGNIHQYLPQSQFDERILMHLGISFVCVIWLAVHYRHYTHRKPFWFELKELLTALLIFAVIELAIIAFSKSHMSRYLWVLTWMIALIAVPTGRVFIKMWLRRLGWSLRDTVIIGNKQNAVDAYIALQSESYLAFHIIGFVGKGEGIFAETFDIPEIADGNNLLNTIDKKTTQFVIALEDDELEARDKWISDLSKHGCTMVTVVPSIRGVPLYGTDMSFLFRHDVILLRITNNLGRLSSRLLKRGIDYLILLSAMPLAIVIFLVVALLIKLEDFKGQVFFTQERLGKNGKIFKCYKFRSMYSDQSFMQEWLDNNPDEKAYYEKYHKYTKDPRVTKVGKVLRKTSLDELPQLINVFKGEMSFVGPRPYMVNEKVKIGDNFSLISRVKPGITGLWQVSGRNEADFHTRVDLDAWYVRNWSIWNDIAILFKTVTVVIKRSGAY